MEQITMFKCGETGKLFDSAEKAKNSERRFRAKKKKAEADKEKAAKQKQESEYQRDYVRLNARYPREIFPMVKEKALEFWGIDLNFNTVNVRPNFRYIRKSFEGTKYILVPNFPITGSIVNKEKFKNFPRGSWCADSIAAVFGECSGFTGFSPGSGNPGRLGKYDFKMDVTVYIDEFPLIMENYEKYTKQKTIHDSEISNLKKHQELAEAVALGTPEMIELGNKLKLINGMRVQIQTIMESIKKKHINEFLKVWDQKNPSKADTSLFSEFE